MGDNAGSAGLHEQLLPEVNDSDDEVGGDEEEAPHPSYCATASQYVADFWRHTTTQTVFHTFRRFLVSGIKVSGTVAFAMYLHMIYQKVTLNSQISDTERNAFDNTASSLAEQYAIDRLRQASIALACAVGINNLPRNFVYDFHAVSRDQVINLAPNIRTLTNAAYQNADRHGMQLVLPAACVDVALQTIIGRNNTIASFAAAFADSFVCSRPATPPSGYLNMCYGHLNYSQLPHNMPAICMLILYRDGIMAEGEELEIVRRSHFFDIQSELYTQAASLAGIDNATGGIERLRESAIRTVKTILNNHYDLLANSLQPPPTAFSTLSTAYHHMGNLLIGIFIGFGILDAMVYLASSLDKKIRPYWYGLLQGIDTGLIKVLLLLTLFGNCQFPNRPTHDDFKNGNKLTFTNIPSCNHEINIITWWSLSWLMPLCWIAAYYELNKFHTNKKLFNGCTLYFQPISNFSQRNNRLLSQLGLAITTFTGLLALQDLLLNHLIPYATTVKGTGGSGLSAHDDLTIKLTLATPMVALGVYVERKYLHTNKKGLTLRKVLSSYNEWCKLILFNYIALSFFFSYEYANHWHATDVGANDADDVSQLDESHSDTLDLTPWQAYWLLLCLAGVGSAIVVHDEWFYKMRLEPEEDPSASEAIELDDLNDSEDDGDGYAGPTMFANSDRKEADKPEGLAQTPC